MKRAVVMLLALTLLSGCASIRPASNQQPKAYVDLVTPAEATEGQTVRLQGHGTDVDGEVVGYRWRSDRDGVIGTKPELETASLSVGDHTIYFAVQDNNDAWSDEVTSSVKVLAGPADPTIDRFDASVLVIEPGDRVTLTWRTSNAAHVFIDQGVGEVTTDGSIVVTPENTTTYILTASGAGTLASAVLTVTVQRSARVVTLPADVEMSGFVRSLGIYVPGAVYVGDDSSDRGIQGFVTFDISRIPPNAVVTRAKLDMTRYEVPYDSPVPVLGCLCAYIHNYTTLYGQYRSPDVLPAPVLWWCSLAELDKPAEGAELLNAVQGRVGKSRFQFRLQFADGETDGNHRNDLLYWPEQGLPTLTVEYYS